MANLNPTIIAQSSPIGIGAIANIRISGPKAFTLIESLTKNTNLKTQCTYWLYDNQGNEIDQALILLFQGPNSFTGEDIVEIHAHGNQLIVEKVIGAALFHGAILASPGEFTQRAYLNGKLSLSNAEAIADLIHAKSEKLLKASINQYQGKLQKHLQSIESALTELLAKIQGQLDFPLDTSDQSINPGDIQRALSTQRYNLSRLVDMSSTSHALREGIQTLILGRPNVGKSSLLNYLLNQDRAIVSDQAGTTRDYLSEQIIIGDIPLNLIDTAGIREHAQNQIEEEGIKKAHLLSKQADLILFVIDGMDGFTNEDSLLLSQTRNLNSDTPIIVIVNKQDQTENTEQLINSLQKVSLPYIFLSALKQTGLEDLIQSIAKIIQLDNLSGEFAFSLNQRQALCLKAALSSLGSTALDNWELLSASIQESLYHLSQISGESQFNPESTLDVVFSNFCIGK